jgi:hypothetical protein
MTVQCYPELSLRIGGTREDAMRHPYPDYPATKHIDCTTCSNVESIQLITTLGCLLL